MKDTVIVADMLYEEKRYDEAAELYRTAADAAEIPSFCTHL